MWKKRILLGGSRAIWDVDTDGMRHEQYKGIDDWELRESDVFYGNAAA